MKIFSRNKANLTGAVTETLEKRMNKRGVLYAVVDTGQEASILLFSGEVRKKIKKGVTVSFDVWRYMFCGRTLFETVCYNSVRVI